MNLVERFFRELTDKRVRRGSFANIPELIAAIDDYVSHHNKRGRPFVWTAKAADILEKMLHIDHPRAARDRDTRYTEDEFLLNYELKAWPEGQRERTSASPKRAKKLLA
jgi:hypothetical protein